MVNLFKKTEYNLFEVQILAGEKESAWGEAQKQSNPVSRYNAYLNWLCLKGFLRWFYDGLTEEKSQAKPRLWLAENHLPALWEFVSGVAVETGQTRLILIPTDEEEPEELRVPQEWVDISSWQGDYYLTVSVNLDSGVEDSWLRFGGFATHRQIKNKGVYNRLDRSYSLPVESLIENLTIMELTRGLNMRQRVKKIAQLTQDEAKKIWQRLADKAIFSPRLWGDISFEKWAALIDNQQWRESLYKRRCLVPTATAKTSSVVNLRQWLNHIFDAGWQSGVALLGEENLLEIAGTGGITAGKLFAVGAWRSSAMPPVKLMVKVTPELGEKIAICLQLQPADGEICLPPEIKLILQDEQGHNLEEVKASSETQFIEINLTTDQAGDQFCVRIALDDLSITERFVV